MGQSPEELRREIEQTRRELSYDVDTLSDKVSPSRVVERRVDRTKASLAGVKDKVMGTAHDTKASAHGRASSAVSPVT